MFVKKINKIKVGATVKHNGAFGVCFEKIASADDDDFITIKWKGKSKYREDWLLVDFIDPKHKDATVDTVIQIVK